MHAIGTLSIRDLAAEYGTPLFVYDQAVIEERIHDLRDIGTVRFAVIQISTQCSMCSEV